MNKIEHCYRADNTVWQPNYMHMQITDSKLATFYNFYESFAIFEVIYVYKQIKHKLYSHHN